MKLSDKLSALNAARFEEWKPNHDVDGLSPAIFAFDGDVYRGLDVHRHSMPERSPDSRTAYEYYRVFMGC